MGRAGEPIGAMQMTVNKGWNRHSPSSFKAIRLESITLWNR